MIQITSIIEQARARLENEISLNKVTRRIYFECRYEEFEELLTIECKRIMAKRTDSPVFEIDKLNRPIIAILWAYLSGREFYIKDNDKGYHEKGIILAGSIGAGKTVLMKGFCNLIPQISNKNIQCIHSIDLVSQIRKNGITEEMIRKPMLLDDLGKEQESVKDFGTDVRPIIDLIPLRYDNGSWTFATTNFKLSTLREKYSPHTADRIIEMFNFIELTGDSRRK